MLPVATARPSAQQAAPRRTAPAGPIRLITRPADGRAITEPAAMASRSSPREPLLRSRLLRMSGTRETNDAKQKPLRMKTRATALRAWITAGTAPANRIIRLAPKWSRRLAQRSARGGSETVGRALLPEPGRHQRYAPGLGEREGVRGVPGGEVR